MFASHWSRVRVTIRSTSACRNGSAALGEGVVEDSFDLVAHRRLGITEIHVPEDREPAPRPQHADDLADALLARIPVEGLGCEDGVNGVVRQRDRLSGARESLRPRHDLVQHGPHLVVGLDRDHAGKARDERAREFSRPGSQIEHG